MYFNGVKLDFNLYDVDFMKKWETSIEDCSSSMQNIKGKKNYEQAEMIIASVRKAFDDTFGKGTADKVFKNSRDILLYTGIYSQLVEASEEQSKEVEERLSKYSLSRANRR